MKNLIILSLLSFATNLFAQKTWSLEECVNHAAENNLTILQNKINEKVSENDLQYAQNQWLPTANGYFDNSLTLGTHHPAIDKGYQQYTNSLGLNSQITIYNGGLLNLNKEKASLVVDSYKFQTETTINDISLLVVNYYLNIV